MHKTYLCYDLKGIQSFIFAIPKLKYICGGSAVIDQFDRMSCFDRRRKNAATAEKGE